MIISSVALVVDKYMECKQLVWACLLQGGQWEHPVVALSCAWAMWSLCLKAILMQNV